MRGLIWVGPRAHDIITAGLFVKVLKLVYYKHQHNTMVFILFYALSFHHDSFKACTRFYYASNSRSRDGHCQVHLKKLFEALLGHIKQSQKKRK